MRALAGVVLLAAALAPPARAELKVEGETTVVVTKLPFRVVAPAGAKLYFWRIPAGWKAEAGVGSRSATVTAAPEGTAEVSVEAVEGDFSVKTHALKVSVGKVAPPVPPEPGPDPPVPPPGPAPIDLPGFAVLIVWDRASEAKLPPQQLSILYDKGVRDYLRAKTLKDAQNKAGAWNIWPAAADVSGAPKVWQDAYARPRKSLPWLVISTGKAGYEGPLPANVAETLALLRKYGGN